MVTIELSGDCELPFQVLVNGELWAKVKHRREAERYKTAVEDVL